MRRRGTINQGAEQDRQARRQARRRTAPPNPSYSQHGTCQYNNHTATPHHTCHATHAIHATHRDQGVRSGGFPARAFLAAFSSFDTFSWCFSSSDLALCCLGGDWGCNMWGGGA
jgi:hypothetical protein